MVAHQTDADELAAIQTLAADVRFIVGTEEQREEVDMKVGRKLAAGQYLGLALWLKDQLDLAGQTTEKHEQAYAVVKDYQRAKND